MTKLVVVEPSRLIQLGLVACLSEIEGLEVISAIETGEAALLAASNKPDAILINIELPDMDEAHAIRHIKARHPDIKVIALFVKDEEEQILAAVQAGADAYCLKYSPRERLAEAIYAVADGGAWLDPPIARKVLSSMAEGNSSNQKPSMQPWVSGKSYQMTDRELLILTMIVACKSNDEIAKALHVSYYTVKSDVTQIFLKLGIHDRVQAAVKALVEGLADYNDGGKKTLCS